MCHIYAIFHGKCIGQAKILYKRIRNRIDRTIEKRKYDIFFTISAGVAEFDTEKDSFNELLKNAKFALHAAKTQW